MLRHLIWIAVGAKIVGIYLFYTLRGGYLFPASGLQIDGPAEAYGGLAVGYSLCARVKPTVGRS
jgi:hypothetical protein